MLDVIVELNLTNRNILVIGAGYEGTKRIASLLNHGCKIIVISETFDDSIFEVEAGNHPMILLRRKIHDIGFLDEFKDIFVVLAATNDLALNKMIIAKSKENNILTYGIDASSSSSDISFTSTINIEDSVQISISTFGRSPLMSKIIKSKIENSLKNIIGHEDISNIKIQEFAREHLK